MKILEPEEIFRSPEKYNKTKIAVKGIFTYEFENVSIGYSGYGSKKIWVDLKPESQINGSKLRMPSTYTAIITGTYIAGRQGHFGNFCGRLKNIMSIELSK